MQINNINQASLIHQLFTTRLLKDDLNMQEIQAAQIMKIAEDISPLQKQGIGRTINIFG
ncbi:MAG: hypothetical protein MJB14_17860 [Spirochaetes bacterium]|nr:hypothetical protein [Spirochaetota bacterium]